MHFTNGYNRTQLVQQNTECGGGQYFNGHLSALSPTK